jgi:hypothetical protein
MSQVVTKEQEMSLVEKVTAGAVVEEVMAYCPACKAFQTLWFTKDQMTPTRKFSQRDGQVYHDCGSVKPCRLCRTY